MYPTFDLKGKVAVVTGASMGIGYGLAKALANAGATVVATARHMKELQSLVDEISREGGEALAISLDVTDVKDIEEVMKEVQHKFGSIDILVNNAGLGANHLAVEVTEEDWDLMMDVNLKGLFFCCQAAGKIMLQQGCGKIVNISSQASVVGIKEHAVYCASKGGVNQLTRVLALEWSSKGVNVNAVAPTFTYTPGTAERLDDPSYLKGVVDRIPIGRVAEIKDVAGAVIYLASPAGDMVTGTVLLIDGGWTAQ
ncbi:SDR family oxidoreductase [Paenibacillus sp. GP183]|uniref:SDR family NAD(P)-dependent oxidoreductase n=1 Tax=Paenibacillus sp. GP183 TaxID=1882751 RepID=UPI00089707C9|nr:SDR family oxidoreductase [Paenibacillus sp. GP183]SEC47077.1 NAD(P)-dependent dehydrogenase, short-chain alcohol dehydrogenase family [Paenibacillus sp. GP183]